MAPSIGLNLRVTGYCNQGGRKYMEDVFSVAYQQTEDEKDLEYAFFGIFDGHGGREAAVFAKEHLMDFIVRQKSFWSDDDESVTKAIHEGFVQTHHAMWKELENWPKTASGLPSTAGTTASIAFIRRGKIYIGHVGDSAIVLGSDDGPAQTTWKATCLTRDHKPESDEESKRIHQSGGKVVSKSGVPRVVWNRPRTGHRGPVRRSTRIDEIPFLAVARSLGDLWSYNSEEDVFVVSPEPDTYVYQIDITKHRCIVLGTDGCWNMLNPQQAVHHVCMAERANEQHMLNPSSNLHWVNPSKRLVDRAIESWNANNLRADNTSVVTVMLDPPGPPRAQVLKRQREMANGDVDQPRGSMALVTNVPQPSDASSTTPAAPLIPRHENARDCSLAKLKAAAVRSWVEDHADSSRDDTIQCNEVSSSQDPHPLPQLKRQRAVMVDDAKSSPLSPRLSRELNALKLLGGCADMATRTQSAVVDAHHGNNNNNSDTENEAPVTRSSRPKSKKPSGQMRSNPHFLRSSEAKVKKASSLLTSTASAVMSLRPRSTPAKKRKISGKFDAPSPAKSPRIVTVQDTKPVMTRSRRAHVLQLK